MRNDDRKSRRDDERKSDGSRRRVSESQTQKAKSSSERGSASKRMIFRRTIFLMATCGVISFSLLLGELWNISITQHDKFSQIASQQQTKDVSVTADRGQILDATGNVVAMSATVYKLILSPLDVRAKVPKSLFTDDKGVLDEVGREAAIEERKELLIDGICSILEMEEDDVRGHMERTKSQYEVIEKNIEKEEADLLRAFLIENNCGYDLYLTPDAKRYYPYSDLASHVVGFVNVEGGAYGIESVYETVLKGAEGRVVTNKTGRGTEMYDTYSEYVDAINGSDINLTIDTTIQHYAEKALEEGIEAFNILRGGFCIVMDPDTGAVLAMASSPDYDLNNYASIVDSLLLEEIDVHKQENVTMLQAKEDAPTKTPEEIQAEALALAKGEARNRQWRNQAINDIYDPGSTFKPLVVAAALEEGVISTSDTFHCPGFYTVNGTRINCWKLTGHGTQTLAEAVENSCNPALMVIGQKLGPTKFYEYFEAYGLKEPTGIELAGEASGLIWSQEYLESPEGYLSLATASFGQRFQVTPLQMITGFASVINGGHLMQPYIVGSLTGEDGVVLESTQPYEVRQVVSEETSETVRTILEGVVRDGSGGKAYVPGCNIGGKTGTSETLVEGEVVVSFMGFAPADDPEVLVLLGYNTPERSAPGSNYGTTGVYISGGNMAALMTGPMISDILDYMGVEKNYTPEEREAVDVRVPNVVDATVGKAVSDLQTKGFSYRVVGTGDTVTSQVPVGYTAIPGNSTVILYLGDEVPPATAMVPDVRRMSYDKAKEKLEAAGFFVRATGASDYYEPNMKVEEQSVVGGEDAELGTVIEIMFPVADIEDGVFIG